MDKIGIRIHVDKNKFPEELKLERACQLLSRTASWIADYPDGDDFMQLFYGPNSWTEQQCLLPDERVGPHLRNDTGDAAITRAQPALSTAVADGRSQRRDEAPRHAGPNMLVQPAVIGYRKHPILLADWIYVDVDNSRKLH